MLHGVRAVARPHVVNSLMVVGVLGLLVAAFLFLNFSIIKMSGPNAFEAIEKRYVDLARVDANKEARDHYQFLVWWIMNNEPALRGDLARARVGGIGFSLLVSLYCFCLAFELRHIRDAVRLAEGQPPPS